MCRWWDLISSRSNSVAAGRVCGNMCKSSKVVATPVLQLVGTCNRQKEPKRNSQHSFHILAAATTPCAHPLLALDPCPLRALCPLLLNLEERDVRVVLELVQHMLRVVPV